MEHRLKFKRIGVVYVNGLTRRFRSTGDFGDWLNTTYEWRMIGKLEPYVASGQWHKAARLIAADWKKCDGFVVVLQSEEFVFTAHAIAMMLGNVGKPIAYVKIEKATTPDDAQFCAQMINALQTVVQDISGHIGVQAHIAFPLLEASETQPRTIYGYFDFGFRLSPDAPQRTSVFPHAPRLKILARIGDRIEASVDAAIVTKDPGATAVPALVCRRGEVRLRIGDTLHQLTQRHPEIMKAQFVWAVQKAFEAGDFSDLVLDMVDTRIDVPERL